MAGRPSGNLVSADIANLIGGVSQQPWNVRMPTQASEMINCHATITEFLRRRPALKQVANVSTPDGGSNFVAYGIDKGTNEQYIALFGKGGISVFDLNGVPQKVSLTESGRKYLGSVNEASVDLRFCHIKDYTFCVNRNVLVNTKITNATTRTPEAVFFIKQASYQTTYTITLDGTEYSYTTPDGIYEQGQKPPELSAELICTELQKQIPSSFTIKVYGAVMWVKRSNASYFTFGIKDSRSDTHTVAFRDSIGKMADLPLVAPNGLILRITGDKSTVLDDYYVKFTTKDGTEFASGEWEETVAPATNNAINPATMPHALIRRKAGEFSFEPIEWKERVAGDEQTNPTPSFVGKTINNILFYRNRLAFLSGDNIIMSEANNFFNFYLTTATTAVDSDPIDVAASGVKDAVMYGSAIYNGGLVIFSTKGQFVLEHDTVLSNSTVSLSPVTEYESTDRVIPQSSGKTIFFVVDRGRWMGIREYIAFDTDSMNSNDATDITAHVPRYLLGKVKDIQCSSNEEILLVSSTSEPDMLYVYKYFWNGNEKMQTAWYKWKMSGNIHSHLFFNTDVYCVMGYADGSFNLEVFSFEPNHKDAGEDFEFCLDRKVDESNMTLGEYDPITKTTTLTLPYEDERAFIITRSGGDIKAGLILPVLKREGRTYTIKTNLTHNTKLFAGVPYISSYEFTTLGIRNQNNTAATSGRLQVRNLHLNLHDTGYLVMQVKPQGKEGSAYVFTGKRLGDSSAVIGDIPIYTGQVKVPVLSRNESVTIVASSNSPLPFALVNGWWEGFYTTRSQRV